MIPEGYKTQILTPLSAGLDPLTGQPQSSVANSKTPGLYSQTFCERVPN